MKAIIFTIVLLYASVANAGDVERIYSITSQTNGSYPGGFFFKDKMFVYADDGIHGYQLWECDSANTLHLISSSLKNPLYFSKMELNNKLFFFCGSDYTGYGLCEFNGVDPPRQLFSNLKFLDYVDSYVSKVFSHKIYTYVLGDGLQEFDGINHPKKIANKSSHFHSGNIPTLTVYKDKLYFISTDNIHGNELWSCDSTGAAVMVADINPGGGSSDPQIPGVYKDKLYFWADDGVHGNELWEYNGTDAPRMIADIYSGSEGSVNFYKEKIMEFNDKLYFKAYDGIHDASLWEFDGSHSPRLIPGTESTYPSEMFIFKDRLYFYSGPGYLYEYDGINNPKKILYSYNWDKPEIFENNLYIWVPGENNRNDLYKYDGINPPENLTSFLISGGDYDIIIVNNRLCFDLGTRLYAYSGDSIHLISGNFPMRINRVGEFYHQYYFQFEDPLYGSELWLMDGIHPPSMYTDLNKTLIIPADLRLKAINDKLFFTFTDSVKKYVEYDSIKFKTLSPDFNPQNVYNLLSYNNKFYYNRETGRLSAGLFENNGVEEHQISPASSMAGLIIFNHAIYYADYNKVFYKYDGVSPPTKISDLNGEYLYYQTIFNDKLLLFSSAYNDDSLTFREYDGFNPPKILGKCLNFNVSSLMHQFSEMDHKFYFTGDDAEHGQEPWVFDGSNPPAILADIVMGANGSFPMYFTVFGNRLYFTANDEIHGREIWVYDGINPPEILLDIEKGSGSSTPEQLIVSNNKLYFKAFTKEYGTELWQYDGISEPSMLSDLFPGLSGSDPNDLVVYKNQLYLSAVTKEEGRQLYRVCESCSYRVISTCDTYNFNGTNLDFSGRYYDTIPGNMARDSIIRLDLTILKSSALVIDTAACEQYTFAGATLTESGMFYDTIPNAAGCDSLITLNLTIHHSTASKLDTVGCESYQSPGGRYVWKESGTYADTIPNASGCDSIITIHLTVIHPNTAVISSGWGLQAAYSGGQYQWVNCLENYLPITGAFAQSFTPLSPGTYAVIMNDQGCIDTSDCYTIVATDLPGNETKSGMTVYPNPTSGNFTIDLGKVYEEARVTITRYDGQVIRDVRIHNSRMVDLNLEESAGIYMVIVTVNNNEFVYKMMKK